MENLITRRRRTTKRITLVALGDPFPDLKTLPHISVKFCGRPNKWGPGPTVIEHEK